MFGWFAGVQAFFGANKWAGWMLGAVSALLALKAYEKRAELRGQEIGRRKAQEAFDKAIQDANEQTASRIERAEQAGEAIERRLNPYEKDPDHSADWHNSLDADELRQLTEDDPHNAGRRVRGA